MNPLPRIGEWIGRHYDRLLAALALVILLGILGWCTLRLGTLADRQQAFNGWLTGMTPQHRAAAATDVARYAAAEAGLKKPVQMGTWSNALFVPETRCWCVDCLRPITLETDVCPFCGFRQPPRPETVVDLDSDFDGLPDLWEKKHGLDPRNADDARGDVDEDGFSNLEEFKAAPQTDPADVKSHPPYALRLALGPVASEPFRLLCMSASTLPDGSRKFQINTRDGGQTYFAKLGESVEGFTVKAYEEKFETRDSSTGPMKVNVSVLTLQRGDKQIPLTMGRGHSYVEYKVRMVSTLDNLDVPVNPGDKITVRDEVYKVISVDIPNGTVVIVRDSDGKQFEVRKLHQAAEPAK